MLNKVMLVGELVGINEKTIVVSVPQTNNAPNLTVNVDIPADGKNNFKEHTELGDIVTLEGALTPNQSGGFGIGIQSIGITKKIKPASMLN